jgi:beta-glucosidase
MAEGEFPGSFVFGAAASAGQAEGGLDHSDWMVRERKGEVPASGSGNDRRRFYGEDFQRLSELGLSQLRTSLEWSRLEPQKGVYNREAVEEYRLMFETAQRRGLTLWLTLQHLTLPAWFSRLGGFMDEAAIQFWHRFVEFAAKEFGRYADFWVPIHEPASFAAGAYLLGMYPPAKTRMDKYLEAVVRIHRAHGDAYRILKAYLPAKAKVGIATEIFPVHAADPEHQPDIVAAEFVDSLVNSTTLEAIKHGVMSPPGKGTVELPSCKGAADFLGIDYFFRLIVSRNPLPPADLRLKALQTVPGMPGLTTAAPGEPVSELGNGAYPPGIYEALKRVHRADLNLPLYVTASGIATLDEDQRAQYVRQCLAQVLRAIGQGLDVRGYFHWCDVDQYEWQQGFNAHFGLCGFDPDTKQRHARPAAAALAAIVKARRLEIASPPTT